MLNTSRNNSCPLRLSNQPRSLVRVPGAVGEVPGSAAALGLLRMATNLSRRGCPCSPLAQLVPRQGAGCRATLGPSSAAGLGHEVMASGGRERERCDYRASGRRGGRRRRSVPPAPSCCPAGGGRRRSPRGVRAAPPPEEAARPLEPSARQPPHVRCRPAGRVRSGPWAPLESLELEWQRPGRRDPGGGGHMRRRQKEGEAAAASRPAQPLRSARPARRGLSAARAGGEP